MLVRVYYNLHRHCLSVQHKTGRGWRVKEYRSSINLKNVKFSVNQTGRRRVIRERRKNVHAYITGEMVSRLPSKLTKRAWYNPYYNAQFVDSQDDPVFHSDYCKITDSVVLIS